MKGIGKPCDGERHARFDEGAMKKCQSAGREAWGCKLPTEADRPELLYPAPRQLVIALLSSEFLGAD